MWLSRDLFLLAVCTIHVGHRHELHVSRRVVNEREAFGPLAPRRDVEAWSPVGGVGGAVLAADRRGVDPMNG